MKDKKVCSVCGRYSDCYKDKCSYCSRLDYLYNQGAMTLEKYNKLMEEWIKNGRK